MQCLICFCGLCVTGERAGDAFNDERFSWCSWRGRDFCDGRTDCCEPLDHHRGRGYGSVPTYWLHHVSLLIGILPTYWNCVCECDQESKSIFLIAWRTRYLFLCSLFHTFWCILRAFFRKMYSFMAKNISIHLHNIYICFLPHACC